MRNQWKITPNLAVGFVALVLTVGVAGFAVRLNNRNSTPFRNLPEFPVAEYRQGDSLWSNSSYRLCGTLDNIILQSKNSQNYLVAITAKGASFPLPVIIPARASKVPLQRQQKLSLKVAIDSSGMIIASDCAID
jgi:hypothetical protein